MYTNNYIKKYVKGNMPNVDSGCLLRSYVDYPRPLPDSLNFSDPFTFVKNRFHLGLMKFILPNQQETALSLSYSTPWQQLQPASPCGNAPLSCLSFYLVSDFSLFFAVLYPKLQIHYRCLLNVSIHLDFRQVSQTTISKKEAWFQSSTPHNVPFSQSSHLNERYHQIIIQTYELSLILLYHFWVIPPPATLFLYKSC